MADCGQVDVLAGNADDQLTITECTVSSQVAPGEQMDFSATVRNDANATIDAAIIWRLNGIDTLSQSGVVDPGQTVTLTNSLSHSSLPVDPGTTADVTVVTAGSSFQVFEPMVPSAPDSLRANMAASGCSSCQSGTTAARSKSAVSKTMW